MYCNQCGKQIDDNASFCIFCGATADTDTDGDQPKEALSSAKAPAKKPAGKKRKTLLFIGIPVLALCAAFLVLLLTGVVRFGAVPATAVTGDESGSGLTLSEPVTVAQGTVPRGGGTLTVDNAESAVNGLTIEVPPDSYSSDQDFNVAESAIQSSGFPKDLMMVSPIIEIENGGAYSSDLMTVKVPCNIPDGHIPLGFYYDDSTKSLESVPVLEEGDGYVTLGVRHFSELGVGAVSETDAAAVDSYDTGFKPGVDDFHMENNGSYIEPGGHCAGQSLATMWYYANKKLRGGPKLWDQYDNYGKDANVEFKTPDMQEDDVMALRIASVAQREATWSSNLRNRFMEASKLSDKATFYGLTYGMKLHKSPQYVSIQRLDASGNVAGGHAIIAYRYEGNRIYVADPNYPGKTDRYLELVDGKFKPYSSAATAADAQAGQGKQYTRINYVGISALYDHPKLTQLWSELESRTVGDTYFPDVNPKFIAIVQTNEGEKEEEVVDGYESQTEKLIIKGVNTSTPMGIKIYVTDGKGQVTKISKGADNRYTVPLTLGDNYIGVCLGKNNEWYDFKWVKVLLPFPYAGEWAGTVRIDKMNIPPPESISSGDEADAACDELTAEIYAELKAMEGTEQPTRILITPTGEKNKFILAGIDEDDPDSSESENEEMVIIASGNTAKGNLSDEESVTAITLEPDGKTTDKIKGKFSITSIKDPSQGIFMTVKLTRVKEE
ncbi:MAG: zinc ribbon domain-containing protein [Clostridiales bacterium]|nr:zinc ribbon domain-containing protein [Clostridiales bacterium]